jgi:hypothetical protein
MGGMGGTCPPDGLGPLPFASAVWGGEYKKNQLYKGTPFYCSRFPFDLFIFGRQRWKFFFALDKMRKFRMR